MKTPAALMEPALDLHVTVVSNLPVPFTVAVHWVVEPDSMEAGWQLTVRLLTLEELELQAPDIIMIPATATITANFVT